MPVRIQLTKYLHKNFTHYFLKRLQKNVDLFLKSMKFMEDKYSPDLLIKKFDGFMCKNDEIYEYFATFLVNNGKNCE